MTQYASVENAVSGDGELHIGELSPKDMLTNLLPSASAQVPGGIRLGTSALTSRSMNEEDIKIVAIFLHRAVQLALVLQKEAGSKMLKDFVRVATSGDGEGFKGVQQLRKDVRAFARKFPLPGVDVTTLSKPVGLDEDD